MKTLEEITKALNIIRSVLDSDVMDADIEMKVNKLLKLTQLMGLSAETKASAKKLLGQKEERILEAMSIDLSPSKAIRFLNAKCAEEQAILEYSDRLNAGIVHGIDGIRSVISLYKQEMQSGLININIE